MQRLGLVHWNCLFSPFKTSYILAIAQTASESSFQKQFSMWEWHFRSKPTLTALWLFGFYISGMHSTRCCSSNGATAGKQTMPMPGLALCHLHCLCLGLPHATSTATGSLCPKVRFLGMEWWKEAAWSIIASCSIVLQSQRQWDRSSSTGNEVCVFSSTV